MGLDMYLNAKRFLFYGESELADKLSENFPELGEARIKDVIAEVGYWRKANAIHEWFVKNVQGGTDDCGNYEVSKDALKKLLEVVEEVLADKSKASKLLPTTSGFFFGSTDYDEFYFNDLVYTKELIEGLLANTALCKNWYFEYHSSW